jgi:hypothetical protein
MSYFHKKLSIFTLCTIQSMLSKINDAYRATKMLVYAINRRILENKPQNQSQINQNSLQHYRGMTTNVQKTAKA